VRIKELRRAEWPLSVKLSVNRRVFQQFARTCPKPQTPKPRLGREPSPQRARTTDAHAADYFSMMRQAVLDTPDPKLLKS